jgi:hypothetical protein
MAVKKYLLNNSFYSLKEYFDAWQIFWYLITLLEILLILERNGTMKRYTRDLHGLLSYYVLYDYSHIYLIVYCMHKLWSLLLLVLLLSLLLLLLLIVFVLCCQTYSVL